MKISLLEYLDRTGQTVSRKFFEKYKDEKKSFIAWALRKFLGERLIR